MTWERIMAWLIPSRFHAQQKDRLEAVVAESIEARFKAEAVADTIKAEAVEEQERANATITKIHERIAAQERRAAERRSNPQINAAIDALKLVQRQQ